MANVIGTHGGNIKYEVRGIAETMRQMVANKIKINMGEQFGIIRGASFIQEEVKESIAGKRVEPKSVDTGKFINSIQITNVKKDSADVTSNVPYANYLEYGTTRLDARNHFKNTQARNWKKVQEIIQSEINIALMKTGKAVGEFFKQII